MDLFRIRHAKNRVSRFTPAPMRAGLASLTLLVAATALHAIPVPAGGNFGPWGDVTGDGVVDANDVARIGAYVVDPSSLTNAERERVVRYGDVNGVTNINVIGNATIDTHDVQRMLILGGGVIDAGTAGAAPAGYGDVNGDGQVDIVDAVMTQRAINGIGSVAAANADISPTIAHINFGNGAIDAQDVAVVTDRAAGNLAAGPAYVDYWPMHLPGVPAGSTQDLYTFVDKNKKSGDFNYQTSYRTAGVEEIGGYTVYRIEGSDNTAVGVFKGQDGSIYALYLQYPLAFQGKRIQFSSPVKVLDAAAAKAGSGSWSTYGLTADTTDYGIRPARIKGTVLFKENAWTPAAGNYVTGTPPSRWSDSVMVRLDVALFAIPSSNFDMQQALFFEFAPFIGLVQRGQAAVQGAPQAETNKPYTMLIDATVRGIRYNIGSPTP